MQIHYNLAGGALPDHTRVRLHLVDAVPHEALIAPLVNVELSLPPGRGLVTSAATGEIPDGPGLDMLGVYPHMHLRGRTLRVERLRDDQTTCLLNVPSWEFHWQQFFFYDSPVDLRAGDRLRITCGYDTSADTKTVTWAKGPPTRCAWPASTPSPPGPDARAAGLSRRRQPPVRLLPGDAARRLLRARQVGDLHVGRGVVAGPTDRP